MAQVLSEDDRLWLQLGGLTLMVGLPLVAFQPTLLFWMLLIVGGFLLVWVVKQRHYPRSDAWWVNALRSAVTAIPFALIVSPIGIVAAESSPVRLMVPPGIAGIGGAYAVMFLFALWELTTRPCQERRLGDDPVLGPPPEADPAFALVVERWADEAILAALGRYREEYRGGQIRALEAERERRKLG